MMIWIFLSLWFAFLLYGNANAQDMYVSPLGIGNSCTLASPCPISAIEELHVKFNTIYFWRGVYEMPYDGIKIANVDLKALDNRSVTLDCQGGMGFVISNSQSLTISSLRFRNCSMALNITATELKAINTTISDCRFNLCDYGVSAIFPSLYIENSIFGSNLNGLVHDGLDSSSTIIRNSNFTSNGKSTTEGRAVLANGYSLKVENCFFSGNNGYKEGGAISSSSQNININACSFSTNTATSGGAIFLQNGYNISISNSTFDSNSGSYGGAVFTDSGSADFGMGSALIYIKSCKFSDNRGTLGGALWANADYTNVYNSTFENNRATYGGAIYCDTPILVNSSNFFTNVAESGWILLSKGKTLVSFRDCTLAGNYGIYQSINEGGKAVEIMPFPRYECTSLFNSLMCGNGTSFDNYNGYIWDLSKLNNTCLHADPFPCNCISTKYSSESCTITSDGMIVNNKDPPTYNVSYTDMFVEPFVGGIGDTVDYPGVSCRDIYRKRGDLGLGIFYISIRRTVFPVLCDSSIFPGQVATMLYKVSSGIEGNILKRTSPAYLNARDSSLLNLTTSSRNYLSSLNEFWDRFDGVSMRLYSSNNNVAHINFRTEPSLPPFGFFAKDNIISSSWDDLASASIFSTNDSSRRFYIAEKPSNDCYTGTGWLVVSLGNDTCDNIFFPATPNKVSLYYSTLVHSNNFLYNFSLADVMAIWVKDNYYESSDAPIISPYPVSPTQPPSKPSKSKKDGTLIAVAILLPILFVVVGVLSGFYIMSYHRRKPAYTKGEKSFSPSPETSLTNFNVLQPILEIQKDLSPEQKLQQQQLYIDMPLEEDPPRPTSKRGPLRRQRPQREISLIFGVHLGPIIGKGSFGAVYSGTWNGAKVAVKAITSQDFSDLYNEAIVLRSMRHPNIVQFYGLFDKDDQYYIVTEFVEGGSMDSLLKAKANYFTQRDLVRLARDAAWGMQLLEQKKVLHRDLAARNLLVDLARQQMTLRVADFGMSRVAETYVAPPNTLTPIKWSAPEVLRDRIYTSKSDVWSLGIVMWEMLNGGAEPYTYMTNKEAKEMIIAGQLLTLPASTPPRMKQLVLKCWSPNPEDRPTFVEIADELTLVLEDISEPKKIKSPVFAGASLTPNAYACTSYSPALNSPPFVQPTTLQPAPTLNSTYVDEQGTLHAEQSPTDIHKLDVLRECAEACAREAEEHGRAFENRSLSMENDPFRFYDEASGGGKTKKGKGKQIVSDLVPRRLSLATIPEEEFEEVAVVSAPVTQLERLVSEPMPHILSEPTYMDELPSPSISTLFPSPNPSTFPSPNLNSIPNFNFTPNSNPVSNLKSSTNLSLRSILSNSSNLKSSSNLNLSAHLDLKASNSSNLSNSSNPTNNLSPPPCDSPPRRRNSASASPRLVENPLGYDFGFTLSTAPSLIITPDSPKDDHVEQEAPFPFYSPPASPVKSPFYINRLFEDNNANNDTPSLLETPNLRTSRLLTPFTDSPKRRRSRSPRARKSPTSENYDNSNSTNSNSKSSSPIPFAESDESNRSGAYLYESTEIWKDEPSESSKSLRLACCSPPAIVRKTPSPPATLSSHTAASAPCVSTENSAC